MNRLLRILIGPVINQLIGKGIDRAAGRGKAPGEMTAAERRQAKKGRQTAKRARQAGRLVRRIGRF